MGCKAARVDLRRIWEPDLRPVVPVEVPIEVKKVRKKRPRKARACRERVRADARRWLDMAPAQASTVIALLIRDCRACGRCVGI